MNPVLEAVYAASNDVRKVKLRILVYLVIYDSG